MKTFKINYVMDFCGVKTTKSISVKAKTEDEAKKMVEQEINEIARVNGFTASEFYVI